MFFDYQGFLCIDEHYVVKEVMLSFNMKRSVYFSKLTWCCGVEQSGSSSGSELQEVKLNSTAIHDALMLCHAVIKLGEPWLAFFLLIAFVFDGC